MELAVLQQQLDDAKKAGKEVFAAIEARADKKATKEDEDKIAQFGAEVERLETLIKNHSRFASAVASTPANIQTKSGVTPADFASVAKQAINSGDPTTKNGVKIEFKNEAPGKQVFKNAGEQLQAIYLMANPNVQGSDKEMAANMLAEVEKFAPSGLSSQKDPDGGYLIEPTFQKEIMKNTLLGGADIVADCRKIPIADGSDRFKAVALDDNSRAQGSRLGGIVAYWVNEAETVAPSKPKLRQVQFDLDKLMAIGYATSENLKDAGQLKAIMMDGFPEEFRFMIANAVVRGDGAGKPRGIIGHPATLVVAKETSQTKMLVAENVMKIINRMPAGLRPGAFWYLNPELADVLPYLALVLESISAYPLFTPANGVGAFGDYDRLAGRPIKWIEQTSLIGEVGDIILANMDQYLLATKGEVETAESMHVRFLYDEMAFRATQRIGGQPLPNTVFTPANTSANFKMAAFLTLAKRN